MDSRIWDFQIWINLIQTIFIQINIQIGLRWEALTFYQNMNNYKSGKKLSFKLKNLILKTYNAEEGKGQ